MPDSPLRTLAEQPRVVAAVGEARAALDKLTGHRMLRRRSPEVSAEATLHGARASAALAGKDYDLAALRGATLPAEPVLQGALRSTAPAGALADVLARAPLQVLARLHVLVAADAVGPERLGRPRLADEAVSDAPGPNPPAEVVASRLNALAELLIARDAAPALVLAAVAHAEVLTLQPFTWGNGLVARALQRLVLVARGLDPKAVCAPEVGHLELSVEYADVAARYAAGSAGAAVEWVEHCARAVVLGAREGVAICEAMQRA